MSNLNIFTVHFQNKVKLEDFFFDVVYDLRNLYARNLSLKQKINSD